MAVASPQRSVPGFDSVLHPQLAPRAGSKSQIFQPPRTPSTTSSHNYFASNHHNSTVNNSRKRARPHATPLQCTTPYSAATSTWSFASADSIVRSGGAVSPAPLVNTRYRFAGGLDTPSLAAAAQYDGPNDYQEQYFRKRWDCAAESDVMSPAANLNNEQSDKLRPSSPNGAPADGFGRVVFDFVGGMVGKVWEYCRVGAFKGFYAGGGRGYDLRDLPEQTGPGMSDSSVWLDESKPDLRESTPIPGQYPVESTFRFGTQTQNETTPPRPAKRLHTDSGSGWVIVPDADNLDSRASSPRLSSRRVPTVSSVSKSYIPRPVATPRSSQQKGIPRRSLIPVSRRPSSVSHAGSPALDPNRRASVAPQRSPGLCTPKMDLPSAEAKRYAARMKRQEEEHDASIKKMNAQLQSMIRQGKEALGTKVEVVDDLASDHMDADIDEGYFDQTHNQGMW